MKGNIPLQIPQFKTSYEDFLSNVSFLLKKDKNDVQKYCGELIADCYGLGDSPYKCYRYCSFIMEDGNE